ncbi:mevalonate kinase family protein [Sunxiuqinia sp. A32]|uniref:mevalonate kinase family protein n=1 Tax=Sunxiuqinia sp. A32 TaxID=3461496 RepID=UPI0040463580
MKRFPAKVLLFGEYGLLYGAKALTLPFHLFGGKLEFSSESLDSNSRQSESLLEIDRFVSYYSHQHLNDQMNFPLNLPQIEKDIQKGLYFNSDIPHQYGVGSSGALCAAIFDHYSYYHQDFKSLIYKKDLLDALKHDFAIMESYFHGTSSGLDPLVSFLDRPVLVENNKVSLPELNPDLGSVSIFLIDTNITSPTGPLVGLFKRKMQNPAFEQSFTMEYLPLNNQLVDAFIAEDTNRLMELFPKFVDFQVEHFQEMIPADFSSKIGEVRNQQIFIKLLGSGGGGFLLAFVPKGKSPNFNYPSLKLVS